jgi:hypothetical protein
VTDDRALALQLAFGARNAVTSAEAPDVITVAGLAYTFLTAATAMAVTVRVDRTTIGPFTPLTRNGVPVALVVNATDDNNVVTIQVLPEDDHNQPTPDVLAWTDDDTSNALATFSLSADTHTGTYTLAHAEGTINGSVSDPSDASLAPFLFQIVIGPGATSQLAGTATVA